MTEESETFDDRGALEQESQQLVQQQNAIQQRYNQVSEELNAGAIDLSLANHQRIELRNASEANNARLAQLSGALHQSRVKEIDALRKQVPGWDTKQGFDAGSAKLGRFLLEQGYAPDFIGKASARQLKNLEQLRQRNENPKGVTDFDMHDVSREKAERVQTKQASRGPRIQSTEPITNTRTARQENRLNMVFDERGRPAKG